MKLAGLEYDLNSLNALLNYVNRQNILNYDIDPPVLTEKLRLEKAVENLDKENVFLCGENIVENFKNILDRFDIAIIGKDDVITESFMNYIKTLNSRLASNLKEKILESGKLKPKSLIDFLFLYSSTKDGDKTSKTRKGRFILNWEDNGDEIFMSQKDQTGFYKFRYMKQMILNICKIFPTIMLKKDMHKKINKRTVPKTLEIKIIKN